MLIRWADPFRDLQLFQDRMNRLFDEAYSGTSRRTLGQEGLSSSWSPAVDIYETNEQLSFAVEVPGFKQEDLSISVENGVLTIQGERKFEEKKDEKNYHRLERAYGHFVRTFTLPGNLNPEAINASLNDGVLSINIAKREEAKPKTIQIGVGGPKQIPLKAAAAKG
ncbi:MAG: Hsp20/alpha crystallin family protein [Acidobacteriia bacterium]|nr:Hsp20/alpha crystallin family protein [Terriglobia bacterium]